VNTDDQTDVEIKKIIYIHEDGRQEEIPFDKFEKEGIPGLEGTPIRDTLEKTLAELKRQQGTKESPKISLLDPKNVYEISSLIRNDKEEVLNNRVKLTLLQGRRGDPFKSFFEKVIEEENAKHESVAGEEELPEQKELTLQQRVEKVKEQFLSERLMRNAHRTSKLSKELLEAKELIPTGNTAYLESNITKAIELYREIAQKYPEDAVSLFNLAVIFETNKFGRFDYAKYKHFSLLSALKGNNMAQFAAGYLYGNKLVSKSDIESVRSIMREFYNVDVESQSDTVTAPVPVPEAAEDTKQQQEEEYLQTIIKTLEKEDIESFNENNQNIYRTLSDNILDFDPDAVAVTNYFASSLAGNFKSAVALGYRHLYGYGVPKSCQTAAYYYQQAAEMVKHEFEDGMTPLIEKVRLTDDVAREQKQNQDDVMDYYQYSADKGSTSSQLIVGYAHMYGLRGVARNGEVARQFFQRAADAGEPEAYAALGNMYAKGIGVPQNNETAFKLFTKGAQKGDPASQNGLGYMYLTGAIAENRIPEVPIGAAPTDNQATPAVATDATSTGSAATSASTTTGTATGTTATPTTNQGNVQPLGEGFHLPKDSKMAAKYFNMSAHQGNPDAQFNLAVLYMSGNGVEQSYPLALKYLSQAAQQGQTLARYHLGVLYKDGLGTLKNCNSAVKFFKHVVEKAAWLAGIDQAFESYTTGKDYHSALNTYQQCAELGVEVAQSNAAYMFDRGYGVKAFLGENSSNTEQLQRALAWYTKAAEQGNVEAYVKVGDYYYYGTAGLTNAVTGDNTGHNTTVQYEKSVYHYRRAADLRNAQAMFNLGIMHEHGIGLPQDFYLAKRYYDMASETDPIAVVPVYLALGKLYSHWGITIAKDYLKSLIYGETATSTPIHTAQQQQQIDEEDAEFNTFIEAIKARFDLTAAKEFFRSLTWSKCYELLIQYEDRVLAILVGLLLLLMFVRHVYLNEQRARQQLQLQQQQQEQQQLLEEEEQDVEEREEQPVEE
jgi:SEL1 protein